MDELNTLEPWRRWAVANLVAMMLVFQVVGLAGAHSGSGAAHNFGSNWENDCDNTPASQCHGQNNSHFVLRYMLESDQQGAIEYTATSVYTFGLTEVSVYIVTGGFKDVFVYDNTMGLTGDWAWTECWDTATYGGSASAHTKYCYPADLVFNLTYKSQYPDLAATRAIACHEMGHTLGLRHYNTSTCMKSPPVIVGSYRYEQIVNHERDHLKAAY